MAHTYTNLTVHVLFSTKDRRPILHPELATQLSAKMAQILKGRQAQPILINGVTDRVHRLFRFPPSVCVADLVEKVKANSSR
jgi:REP element-mobilizing transposase RayT